MLGSGNPSSAVPCLEQIDRVCCLGAGRVGILSMSILSHYWPEKQFIVLDKDADIIDNINAENDAGETIPPFQEPDMNQYVHGGMERGNLHFSSNINDVLDQSQMIFIAVDVPLKVKPKVIKNDLDMQNLEDALKTVFESNQRSNHRKYVAVKSTLPVDYQDHFLHYIEHFDPSDNELSIITNPEFFSDGIALQDLLNPEFVILGHFYKSEHALTLFQSLYAQVVPPDRIVVNHSRNATQLGKLLSNAILAAQLTLVNIGSSLCERVNSDFDEVKSTITANPRVNRDFLESRAGYGGLGLTKDVKYLMYLCDHVGMNTEKKIFGMLNEMRIQKMDELVQKVSHLIGDSKDIAVYGFSNKAHTDDIRESPAIYLCQSLLKIDGVHLKVYDPWVSRATILECFNRLQKNRVNVVANAEGAWDVNAMIFLVDWPEFSDMLAQRHEELRNSMRNPSIICDCCNLISDDDMGNFDGSIVYRLGKA